MSAYGTTYFIILIVGSLCLIGGIVKCWSIARRPTTNAKCISGLMLLLIGWLLSFVGVGLIPFLPMPAVADLVLSLAALGLCMSAAVLAFIGLQEYSRRPKHYKQGRAQAIWTLLLSALIITMLFVNVAKQRRPARPSNDYLISGHPIVLEDFNFRFLHPGERWIKLKRNTTESNAVLLFKWERPEIDFLIVAERAPHETYSTEDLADTALQKLSEKADSTRLLYRGPTRINRLEGLRLHIETDRAGEKFYDERRVFATNHLTYQLITSGRRQDKEAIAQAAQFLAYRFELLDYSPRSNSETNSEFRRRYLQ